ncbi:MAG TPA: hypothetical protein VMY42_13915 [Thermoguttaceae bacterium]|nr:hypothetical protein [Thermoguttaceae bacterium]
MNHSAPPIPPKTQGVPAAPPPKSGPPKRNGWEELLMFAGGLVIFLAGLGGALRCLFAITAGDGFELSDADRWAVLCGGFRAIGFALQTAVLLAIFARMTRAN